MRGPISVDPVKEMPLTPGSSSSVSPTEAPTPVIRFRTPGGRPASSNTSASLTAQSGAPEAGLKMMVLPQTSAGAIFQAGIAMGKFQGVMIATAPMGSSDGVV